MIRSCARSSVMRRSTRSSAFLPATGCPAIGEERAGGGATCGAAAGVGEDCANAVTGRKSNAAAAVEAKSCGTIIFILSLSTSMLQERPPLVAIVAAVIDGWRRRRIISGRWPVIDWRRCGIGAP